MLSPHLERQIHADAIRYCQLRVWMNTHIACFGTKALLRLANREFSYVTAVSFLYSVVPRGDGWFRGYLRERLDG